MRYLLFFSILLLFACQPSAQTDQLETLQTHWEKTVLSDTDPRTIYIGDGNSGELFFHALVPKGQVEGALVLFPPTGQTTDAVLAHNLDLARMLLDQKIILLVPSINFNLCLDEPTLVFINGFLEKAIDRYKIPEDKMVLGGFSLGGMNALRYVEISREDSSRTTVFAQAVFGVDPPLDYSRLYHAFTRSIAKKFSAAAVQEAEVYLAKLEGYFGGAPETHPDPYIQHSIYARSQPEGGNARYLRDTPVRIYCDPDIDWHLRERQNDMYDMNAIDHTAFINQLHLLGNEQAEFVNALGKGYRLDGRRHPHSWSIMDPEKTVAWINKILK